MTVPEWFQRIELSVKERVKCDVAIVDDTTISFLSGAHGCVVHAHSSSTAGLGLSLNRGGEIGAGSRLEDRVQHIEPRYFSIDNLSVNHVADAIVFGLTHGTLP